MKRLTLVVALALMATIAFCFPYGGESIYFEFTREGKIQVIEIKYVEPKYKRLITEMLEGRNSEVAKHKIIGRIVGSNDYSYTGYATKSEFYLTKKPGNDKFETKDITITFEIKINRFTSDGEVNFLLLSPKDDKRLQEKFDLYNKQKNQNIKFNPVKQRF
jgi:hypothetical protein